MTTYKIGLVNKAARRIVPPILKMIFRLISRVEVYGFENIPDDPYILVFNHVSLFEAPMIVAHWPSTPEVLGASDVWERPGQNILAHLYGGIPIDRGVVDRTALHRAVAAVQSGRSLIISPEGTRSKKPGMQIGKSGITYILDKTKVQILPVGIVGSTPDFLSNALKGKKPSATVRVGEPFLLPELNLSGDSNAEIRQKKVDYVMKKIAELLPPEYRGYYA
jgi:1-acyl-sn-glycerol-3-phosphate acyltransferase